MARRSVSLPWVRLVQRQVSAANRLAIRSGTRAMAAASRQAAKLARPTAPSRAAAKIHPMTQHLAIGPAGARRYLLFEPEQAIRKRSSPTPRPMLVMLHGCHQTAAELATSTRMNRLAAANGFAVMYPQQDLPANPHGCWNWFDSRTGRAQREAASIMAAVDQAVRLHQVDPKRVAVAGLSAGASMAALLALRYPTRIAAVIMHSGVDPRLATSSPTAVQAMRGQHRKAAAVPIVDTPPDAAPAPPLLVIHGGRDNVVAKINGMRAAQAWAATAAAEPGAPRIVRRGLRYPLTTMDWHADGRLVTTLVEVAGLAHAWSGGARGKASDPQGPDASRMAWSFARKQFVCK